MSCKGLNEQGRACDGCRDCNPDVGDAAVGLGLLFVSAAIVLVLLLLVFTAMGL
jgi:hypothetical protein